jgi:NAD(P)H-hydrate epimerase
VAEANGGCFASAGQQTVLELAGERDVTALGPGLGRSGETQAFVRGIVERLDRPLVLDADALFAVAEDPTVLRRRRAPTVLTPHPGEAARLLDASARQVNRDRPAAARSIAERTGSVTLLKGAASVVASPDGLLWVNPTGGPALGSGGTGDVLAGVVAAFLAQGVESALAAALAAFVHGAAADRIAARQGDAGLAARDLATELPPTMDALCDAARARGEGQALALPFPEPR